MGWFFTNAVGNAAAAFLIGAVSALGQVANGSGLSCKSHMQAYLPLSTQTISTARMRVPRKARKLYDAAAKPFRKRDYAEAQGKLDRALHLYPAFPEALVMQGFMQIDLNEWEAAEQSLQAAVRSDPTYGWAYLLLSDLYNQQRRFDDALTMSQRAVQLIPNVWFAHYEMCQALMGKEQFAQALVASDAVLNSNRGTLLHLAKAHALIGLGRYQEAAIELRAYLQYQPAGEGSRDAHDLLEQIQGKLLCTHGMG